MIANLAISEFNPLSSDGFDLLAELHRLSFEPQGDAVWSAGELLALVDQAGVFVFLAESNGRPAGFVLVRLVLDEAELITIAVVPSSRNRGVGRALLGHLVHFLKTQGVNRLFLEVRDGNQNAICMYQSFGFQMIGRRPAYYQTLGGNRKDALCFALILDN